MDLQREVISFDKAQHIYETVFKALHPIVRDFHIEISDSKVSIKARADTLFVSRFFRIELYYFDYTCYYQLFLKLENVGMKPDIEEFEDGNLQSILDEFSKRIEGFKYDK